MFSDKSKRYMTRMIDEVVHVEIQKILWDLIDEQPKNDLELDYLQVFELKAQHGKQHIIHRQEVPEKEETSIVPLHSTQPINTTIWCIDSRDYQMMFFPEDY